MFPVNYVMALLPRTVPPATQASTLVVKANALMPVLAHNMVVLLTTPVNHVMLLAAPVRED